MKLGLFLIITTLSLFAQDFVGSIRNFNLNYSQPSGRGSSDYLSIDNIVYDQRTEYEVELQAGSLILTTPDNMIQIDELPSSIVDVDSLLISALNMTSDSSQIHLGMNKLHGATSKDNQEINNFSLHCQKQLFGSTFNETVLHSCLNISGSLRVKKYVQKGKTQFTDLKLNTTNTKMKFEIKTQGLKAKGKGRTFYQNNMIRIKIEKANVGPINVKGKLFDALKKMRSPSFRVNKPWIEIDV